MLIENVVPTAPVAVVAGGAIAAVAVAAAVLWAIPQRLRPAILRPAPTTSDLPTPSVR
jgi:fatty acid/phospholipid biosynthesis enzyme